MLLLNFFRDNVTGQFHHKDDADSDTGKCTLPESSSNWSEKEALLDHTSRTESTSTSTSTTRSLRSVSSKNLFSDDLDKRTQASPVSQKEHGEGVEVQSLDKSFQTSKNRSRKLPGTWYYSSNHIMINNERVRRDLDPLTRESELDAVARWHAEAMANVDTLHHSDPCQLKMKMMGMPCKVIGENVAKGIAIRSIHNNMLENPCDMENILDPRYTRFGMATARGSDGNLYLCQIFRG